MGSKMAIFHPTSVTCFCGASFVVNLTLSANVSRNPDIRRQILDGSFHRVVCTSCGECFSVERPFFYSDRERFTFFLVQPRGDRFKFRRDSKRLQTFGESWNGIESQDLTTLHLRVVYGLDELREKLILQDSSLNDRLVELLKIIILNDHPFLLQKPRLQLFVSKVNSASIEFSAYHHNCPEVFQINFPGAMAERLLSRPEEFQEWVETKAHHQSPITSESRDDSNWVNFRRWSTRYPSLEKLSELEQKIQLGEDIDLRSEEFKMMIDRLPRGNQLPSWAKHSIRVLFNYAVKKEDESSKDKLFEVRFGIELEDEWALNDKPDDIDAVWKLFETLPFENVEGNTWLKRIEIIPGNLGLYLSSGVVQIGEQSLSDENLLDKTLRHEVGHAVHEQKKEIINPWLERKFGWKVFPANRKGVDDWISELGGWDSWGPITEIQRTEIAEALITALGVGEKWNPGPLRTFPPDHPWNQGNFSPRRACIKTKEYWYNSTDLMFRFQENKKIAFLNFWYREFSIVNTETIKIINKFLRPYSAMSPFEFFADLYDFYFSNQISEVEDFPSDIIEWFETYISRSQI
jgi:hypothetical protein